MTGHVVMVGLMGSGKTTIGTRVAARLGIPFVDSDAELARTTGMTARDLLARDGVERMHELEGDVVRVALDRPEPSVVGAPASIVLTESMRERLRHEFVVWLRVDAATVAARLATAPDDGHRPFVDRDASVLAAQQRERDPLYAQVASITIDVARHSPDESADLVVAAVAPDRSGG